MWPDRAALPVDAGEPTLFTPGKSEVWRAAERASWRHAVEAAQGDDGWANLSPVGSHIANQSPIDHRTFGFAKLRDLFASIDLFEVKEIKNGNQNAHWVRNRNAPVKKVARKSAKKSAEDSQ